MGYCVTTNDASTIGIACTHCQTRYRVTRAHLGRSAKCKRCGETFVVSSPDGRENIGDNSVQDEGEYRLIEGVDQPAANNRYVNQNYLSTRCPLCRTLIRSPESSIGEQVKCPDCYTMVDVVAPPKPQESPPPPTANTGPEYRVLEGVDQPDAQSLVAHQEYLSFKCPVCQTRIRAAVQRAGELIRCPDCGEPVAAPAAPTEPAPRSPYANRIRTDERMSPLLPETGEGYAISPQEDFVRSNIVPAESLGAGAQPEDLSDSNAATPDTSPHTANVSRQPREDSPSTEHRERKAPPPSPNPLAFLRQWQVVVRWVAFALVQGYGLRLVGIFLALAEAGGREASIMAMGAGAALFLLNAVWLVIVSANLVAIVRETSAGVDKLQQWTGYLFLDWIGDFLYIVVALAVSLLPGVVTCQILHAGNLVQWAVVAPISAWLLFPILFLAALDGGGPFTLVSTTVYGSLAAKPFAWLKLYLASGLLWTAAAGLVLAVLSVAAPFGLFARFTNSLILVAALLVYFRWLGNFAGGFLRTGANWKNTGQ